MSCTFYLGCSGDSGEIGRLFWIIKKMWGKRVVDFAVKKKKVVELTEELK